MKKPAVTEIFASLLILLFAYTATSKLLAYRSFARTLRESPLIHNGADTIGWLLPAIEYIVVLLLFFPALRTMGFYASACLLFVFTLYLSYMLLFVPHLPCSCGGVLRSMSWQQHIFFNLFFLGLSVSGIYLHAKHKHIS